MSLSVPKISEQIIEQMHQELAALQQCIYQIQVSDAKLNIHNFNSIEDCLSNLKQLFNNVDQLGLHACCERLQLNISNHLMSAENLSAEECALILEWKILVNAYILNLNNERIADAIVANLAKVSWNNPIDFQDKKKIKNLLLSFNSDVIDKQEYNLAGKNIADSDQEIDLDLSAEKVFDHDVIDLNEVIIKSENKPSSQVLDDIEKELFTEDENIIIINEVSDNNSVIVTDDEFFSPANDTQIKSVAVQEVNINVDEPAIPHSVEESSEACKENTLDEQDSVDYFNNELFSSEELTEINLNTIELNAIEDQIISLGDETDNSLSNEVDKQYLNQEGNTISHNNSAEKILQSIEDELFMPIEENENFHQSSDNGDDENNLFNDSFDDPFQDEINSAFKESTEADHFDVFSDDQSDHMLDSLQDELFTPDSIDINSSHHEISLFSEIDLEDSSLGINNEQDIPSSRSENEQKFGKLHDESHELDDLVNSLYTEEDHQSTDDESIVNRINAEAISDNDIEPHNQQATFNNDEAIKLDYPDWNEEQKELLNLIVIEVKDALDQQEDMSATFLASPIEENVIREFMSLYVEQVERMASAAEMVGLLALHKTCEVIHEYLSQYEKEPIEKTISSHKTILLWPQVVLEYLTDIYAENNQSSVIEYLSDDAWCQPIGEQQITELQSLFVSSTINIEQSEEDKRKDVATDDDVSIIIPDDVQAELLDGLLQELPNQTEEFSHAVQTLNEHDFLRHIEIAQRIAHTIKGAANTVGIQGLASVTHNLEDILSALAKNKVKPTTNLQAALIDGSDCLEQMTEHLLGVGPEPQDSLHTLQVILDWANYIDEFGPPTETEDEGSIESISQPVKESTTHTKVVKTDVTTTDQTIQNAEAALRIPAATIDNLLMQSGENIIAASQMHDQVRQLLHSLRDVKSNRDHVQEISQSLEHLIDIQGVGSRYLNKVNDQKFDPLELDQYNELHTYSRRLIEATNDSVELVKQLEDRLSVLHALISDQVSAQKESQYDMLKTRMVQVDSIAARLKRGVRQAAKICNKSVQLEIIGGETLVDNKILVNLIDPLMHLLRNAVDHGLESDEERQSLKKPLPAVINLEVRQDGDRMIVICQDDGRGLDVHTIRNRAIEYKLIDSEQTLDDDQVKQLILQHGFSTRSEVTQLSGRGVGLDVVASQVKSMNGLVSVHSEQNKGTSFELSMPVSLLSAHALLLELSIGSIAVSTVGVEEIIHLEKSQLIKHGDKSTYKIDDKLYQIKHIEHLLGLPDYQAHDKSTFYTGMKISGDTKIIVVPNISNTREIIIKPFSKFLPKVAGLIGTTILGNGEISSVIDIKDLLEYNSKTRLEQRQSVINVEINQPKLTALIVEDSLSTRKSLAEFMRDLHYEVYTAKDGLEAIEVMSECQPNIILSDLEMPRMNGLELTSHLRANQKTKDIPVIMITSRSTDKHVQEAKSIGVNEYLTKPFREDILFEKVNQLAPLN